MITREQLYKIFDDNAHVIDGRDISINTIITLITEQDEQYRELVEAAVALDREYTSGKPESETRLAMSRATKPFLPPKPSLSENLEALRPRICQDDSIVDNKLKEYIAEAKQLEAKLNE